jgi:hypothetical protein
MAATDAQIARLRRLVNEPDDTTYEDADIAGYIEAYPLRDERGKDPYTWDASATPPEQTANESWIPTYDLNAAAADIWDEKAAILAGDFDFSADGGNYSRSQAYEQAMGRVKYFRGRRRAKTGVVRMDPPPGGQTDTLWIGNLSEED